MISHCGFNLSFPVTDNIDILFFVCQESVCSLSWGEFSQSFYNSYPWSQFHFWLVYHSLHLGLQAQMRRLWALWFASYQICYFDLIFLTQCLPSSRRPLSTHHSWLHTSKANFHGLTTEPGMGTGPGMRVSDCHFSRIKASSFIFYIWSIPKPQNGAFKSQVQAHACNPSIGRWKQED